LTGLFDIVARAIVQAITSNEVLGRATTFIRILAVLLIPLSAVLGGWIIDQVGSVSMVFTVLGCFIVFVALAFLRSLLAHVERYLPQAPPSSGREQTVPSP